MQTPPVQVVMATLDLFHGLTPDDLARVAPALRYVTRAAGATLITVEEPGEQVFIICNGVVKVHVIQPDGRDIVLALLGAGQILGEMSLVDGFPASASALALEPCTLLAIERRAFEHLLRTIPALAYNLALILSRRLRRANLHLQAMLTLDLRTRVVRQLLLLAHEFGQPTTDGGLRLPLRLTQSDLADLVGASRFRVNQALIELRQRGIIATDASHRLIVRDYHELARLAPELDLQRVREIGAG
ncbi:MAG: Crp/Fnr family transcriptional regulator [Roseiflexus sp.]|nr:Crp/Fnr family transcriptional regulator [Roseiflexus sp.]MCS7290723.1 Crp/Fnr family transcriptional regulator [Roseiflexus sp.]MDW8147432.1 Crp/Fnr family transcriptional regulator [Roseiflexaceae bacterium]MDW8233715.1 Crp/Fnr family transcriptional regulator [Roseiflexaceae bacterium]